ncbi:hypothetical protein N431DRAFT_465186 [Stipitochalara longipes BDJ]|nr:hypothetical protein N431DRAFT_465186 [Stipitochalara longipes BDJ]
MTSPSSTCATHGSTKSTSTGEPLTSKVELSRSQQDLSSVSSSFKQSALSHCPLTNYLKDPTTAHVEPRHVSPQESSRIYNKKETFLKHLEDTLNDGKK